MLTPQKHHEGGRLVPGLRDLRTLALGSRMSKLNGIPRPQPGGGIQTVQSWFYLNAFDWQRARLTSLTFPVIPRLLAINVVVRLLYLHHGARKHVTRIAYLAICGGTC